MAFLRLFLPAVHRCYLNVITSYSIHYTKLYEGASRANYYSMPASLGLKTGACYGGFGTAVFDGAGGYSCKAE